MNATGKLKMALRDWDIRPRPVTEIEKGDLVIVGEDVLGVVATDRDPKGLWLVAFDNNTIMTNNHDKTFLLAKRRAPKERESVKRSGATPVVTERM